CARRYYGSNMDYW
nr:immunoglobulin heavy chain junction region [Mus musculus]MBK4189512.1 immunoglobulin heavy chain junction region [Mus musculus]MBK4189513.1 immunoglobulin heavy chain junction region [Mus musculus]